MSIEFHGENDKNYSHESKEKTKWAIIRFWVSILQKRSEGDGKILRKFSEKSKDEKISKNLRVLKSAG
jgi:hypothetical protein